MTKPLAFEDFEPRVGDRFALSLDGLDGAALTLSEAQLYSERHQRQGGRPPFSLIFLGPGEFVLPQQIYALRHDALGELEIFLVPVGRDAEGVRYQAVFN
jgi:hypothetical protein